MKKQLKQAEITINPTYLNLLSPMGLEFKRNSLVIGENLAKIYGIIKYPQEPEYGWLSKLTNIPGTIADITFKPIDEGGFLDSLSRNIGQSRGNAESTKDALLKSRANKAADDGEKIMEQIDQEGETVGLMAVNIMAMASDESVFTKIVRKTESTCKVAKCKPRLLANLQKEAFKMISPFYTKEPDIQQICERIVPLSSFVGGFPFASSGLNDGSGAYFGKDSLGNLIVLDFWKRGDDRTNSCITVMGVGGVGKSTVLKHIALSEYMLGTKLIFIDPETEYKELCHNLKGDWINASGGSKGKINPLHIRPVPKDDDNDDETKPLDNDDGPKLFVDEGNGLGDLSLHMKTLDIFFNLYVPSLTDKQKAILKRCLIELYNNFGITWETDTSNFKNTDFPIMSDLHKLIKSKAEGSNKDNEQGIFDDLALLLEDISVGSDSFIWNGYTSIETSSRCIVLDTNALQGTSDNVKRTQYFNILSWCWQQMSADRNERVILVCDESYLLIDPNVPESLIFLRNAEKRARKYEAGIFIISHSVVDFLHGSIKQYGQALLDIPSYKILMGTDGKNIKDTKDIFDLTDAEAELLASKKRGHALALIGAKRIHINLDKEIPEYKMALMGKAGGK